MLKKTTELCDVVNRMTYKPGWKFSVKGDMINASHPIIDADNPTDTMSQMTITFTWGPIPSGMKDYKEVIFNLLKGAEEHEIREFFKVDGKHAYPPHKANGQALPETTLIEI